MCTRLIGGLDLHRHLPSGFCSAIGLLDSMCNHLWRLDFQAQLRALVARLLSRHGVCISWLQWQDLGITLRRRMACDYGKGKIMEFRKYPMT